VGGPAVSARPAVPSLRRRLAVGCAASLASLVLAEGALRLLGFLPRTQDDPMRLLVADARLGFRNRPDASLTWRFPARPSHITTDSLGFRNGLGWSAREDDPRPIVAFVGDSTTFNAEVDDEETFPSHVARLLGGEYRVLNAGVRAYNSLQAERMLEECLERFPEIRAAVYTHCTNDLQENLEADAYDPLRAPVLALEGGRIVDVEVPVPADADPFQARRPWPKRAFDALRARSVLVHRVVEVARRRDRRVPRDGAPGDDGLDGSVQTPLGVPHRLLRETIRRMRERCGERGIPLLVTVWPAYKPPPDYLAPICADLGVRFVPVQSSFPGAPERYLTPLRRGRFDAHAGPVGTATLAAALLPALVEELERSGAAPR